MLRNNRCCRLVYGRKTFLRKRLSSLSRTKVVDVFRAEVVKAEERQSVGSDTAKWGLLHPVKVKSLYHNLPMKNI